MEPDTQIDDADDQSEVVLSDCEDGDGSEVQGVEEEPLQSPEASPVHGIFDDDLPEAPCCEVSQPSSPMADKDVIEIPDTPGHGNQESDGGEGVKKAHIHNREGLEDKISALQLQLNNAKKMYASKFFGFNSIYLLHHVQTDMR